MSENVGDLNVKIGLDTSGLEKGEAEAIRSLGRTEGVLSKMADAVKKAFAGLVAGVAIKGLKDFFSQSERSFSAFSTAMTGAVSNTVSQFQALGRGIASTASSIGPSALSLVTSLGNVRTLLLAGVVGGAVLAGLASLSSAVQAAVADIDRMSVAASRLGQTTQYFSSLSFAARSTGVSVDEFRSTMATLSDNLKKDDALSPFIRGLQSLGIESKDATSTSLTLDQVLSRVADKFATMKDGVNKTAIATAIFGDKGAELIPMLNRGSAAIEELRQSADRLGGTIGDKAAESARKYTENMARFHTVNSAISNQLGQAFLPMMTGLSSALSSFVERANLAAVVGGAVRGMLGAIYVAARPVIAVFETFNATLRTLASMVQAMAGGDFAKAMDEFKEGAAKVGEVWAKAGEDIVNTGSYIAYGLEGASNSASKLAEGLAKAGDASGKIDTPSLRSTAEILAAQARAAAEASNKMTELVRDREMPLTAKLAELRAMVDAGSISWQQYFSAVRSAKDLSRELSDELTRQNQAFAQMQAQDALGNARLPMQDKIELLNASVRNGTLGWREYIGMMKQVNAQGEQAVNDLMSTTSQALTTIFRESKTAAIAAALINTYQAITKALATYPPPFSYAMAGLQAAMGFAQVQQIRNTSQHSTSGGGTSVASSGAATAEAASAGAGSAGSNQTLTVAGIDPKSMFSGEVVRALAGRLVEFQRDGGQVVFAR